MRIIFLLLLLPGGLWAQNQLLVDVSGVRSSDGYIQVALYNQKDAFLKTEGVYRNDSTKAQQGVTRLAFNDLPPGNYALAVFHDANANDRLDTNWVGIPKEPMGFSNARMKTFGPPSFEECLVELKGNTEIAVEIE